MQRTYWRSSDDRYVLTNIAKFVSIQHLQLSADTVRPLLAYLAELAPTPSVTSVRVKQIDIHNWRSIRIIDTTMSYQDQLRPFRLAIFAQSSSKLSIRLEKLIVACRVSLRGRSALLYLSKDQTSPPGRYTLFPSRSRSRTASSIVS
jgi:hypothetical protein